MIPKFMSRKTTPRKRIITPAILCLYSLMQTPRWHIANKGFKCFENMPQGFA